MSAEESRRIKRKYTNIALGLLAAIAAYMIGSVLVLKRTTIVYNIVVIGGLIAFWVINDIIGPSKAREFEGRSQAQMDAYRKYAAMDLIGYVGLAYFALAIGQNSGIYGALVYAVTRMMKRRFQDEYDGVAQEDEEETVPEQIIDAKDSGDVIDTEDQAEE